MELEIDARKAVCFREAELESHVTDGTTSEVRPGYRSQKFNVIDAERGIASAIYAYRAAEGFHSPMHFHNFQHVRYVISGSMAIGGEALGPGDCVYNPEHQPYDIRPGTGDFPYFLQLDMPGPCGAPVLVGTKRWGEALQEMSKDGTVDGQAYRPHNGQTQHLEAAVLKHLTGRQFERKKPVLAKQLTIHTNELEWMPYAEGVSVKHIAYVSGMGPNTKLVRLQKGAVLPAGISVCEQARFVLEGSVTWGGKNYGNLSIMYYPPDVAYPETRGEADSTTLFVAQWANAGKAPPPFSVL